MKLLFDENLSPRLPELLEEIYPGSVHVRDCGLKQASDTAVWEYAKSQGYTIVSKDSDFQERSVLWGGPPKVIWVRIPNCGVADVAGILSDSRIRVERFITLDAETCLILGR